MGHDASHGYNYYVKIWGILMVLLVISLVGPELKILAVTLITAFGVALIKAGMVAAYFMHLNIEKKYIWGLLVSALIFLVGLFIGVAPDVLNNAGTQWIKCNAYDAKHLTRYAEEGIKHEEIGFNASGRDCTPQRF